MDNPYNQRLNKEKKELYNFHEQAEQAARFNITFLQVLMAVSEQYGYVLRWEGGDTYSFIKVAKAL